MTRCHSGPIAGGAFLAVAACLFGQAPAPTREQRAPAPAATLTLGNEEGKVVPLSPRDWARLPRRTVEVKGREGVARYEGVPLAEVLRFVGVPLGGHLRGPRVAEYVLVEAADGYRAAFALAEVDPGMTDKVILLADRLDGKPLPASAGPYRLVVPGDKVPSRWVKRVTRVTVQTPPASRGAAAPKR